MLTDGTLTQFQERDTTQTTTLLGQIAHRECINEKSEILDDIPFTATGRRTHQFIKTGNNWKMTPAAWCDDPIVR